MHSGEITSGQILQTIMFNKLRKAEIMIMFKIRILVQPCFWVLAIIEQFVSESTDTQYYNKRMKYLFIYNWIQTACGQWKTSWHAIDRKTWGMMMRNGNCCFVDTIGATGVKRRIWTAGISFFSSLAWLLHIMPSPRQLSIYSANIWTECSERGWKLHFKQKMLTLMYTKKRENEESRWTTVDTAGFLLFFLLHMLWAVSLSQSDTTE